MNVDDADEIMVVMRMRAAEDDDLLLLSSSVAMPMPIVVMADVDGRQNSNKTMRRRGERGKQ